MCIVSAVVAAVNCSKNGVCCNLSTHWWTPAEGSVGSKVTSQYDLKEEDQAYCWI